MRRADVLIEGGGIQGATAAYVAARQGLSVLLVERGDLGGGASSNSMKVLHGGLRYLQSLDLPRSFESLRERRRLQRLAPDLVRPLPVRMELAGRSAFYRAALRAGLLAHDVLSAHRNRGLGPEQRLPRSRYPRWHDALVTDTERLLLAFLHEAQACRPGAVEVRTRAQVRELVRHGGRVHAAEVEGIGRVEVGAVLRCVGATRPGQPVVLAMNLLVDARPLNRDGSAVALRHPVDGRNVFAVPWRGCSILGTWNGPYPHPPEEALRVEPAWIDQALAWLAPVHPELAELTRADVRFVHAGLLPREPGPATEPSDRARVEALPDGVIEVQGVKWTTAQGLSERAVAAALRHLGQSFVRRRTAPLQAHREQLDAYLAEDPARRSPLVPGTPQPERGRLLFAVDREWAHTLEDVLLRRTGLASAGHPGAAVVEASATLLQEHLGWSDAETRAQVEAFEASFHFAATSTARSAGTSGTASDTGEAIPGSATRAAPGARGTG